MKAPHLQGIHQPQAVFGHIAQGVRRGHRQAELVAQQLEGQVGAVGGLVPAGQADIAIVVADHPKALLTEGDHHFIGPVDQLPAQAHDQQQSRVRIAADTLIRQADLRKLDPFGRHADVATRRRKRRNGAHQRQKKSKSPHERNTRMQIPSRARV
ncbi:hypothetical protein D9M71_511290 [compost metagenome]